MSEQHALSDTAMIGQMFDQIENIAVEVYGGKRVLFIVSDDEISAGEVNFRYFNMLYPERTCSIAQQRKFVTEAVLNVSIDRIIIFTESPFILSDAFDSQVYLLKSGGFEKSICSTFGADPGKIVVELLAQESDTGELSTKTIDEYLSRNDWTIEKLQGTIHSLAHSVKKCLLTERLLAMLEDRM